MTADHRVETARKILAAYDQGQWTGWTDPANVVGHLAAAVRMLLKVVDTDPAAGKLAEIRAVLDTVLDEECGDRQLALEEIDRIAGGES